MALPDSVIYPKPLSQERPSPKPTKTGKAPFKAPSQALQGEIAYDIYGELKFRQSFTHRSARWAWHSTRLRASAILSAH